MIPMNSAKKRVGSKMAMVAAFVAHNPGLSMLAAARHVGPNGSIKYGYEAVHRAIDAGLVWAISCAGHRTRLYPIVEACAEHEDCGENIGLAVECAKAVA